MIMPNPDYYYEFDTEAIRATLEAAREATAEQVQVATADPTALDLTAVLASDVTVTAACVTVTVRNRKVCLSLPFGLGSVCLPIPISVGDGTSAQACLSVRTIIFGIPVAVCATVSVGGIVIVRQCFGL
jgi:hypothetical protein